MRIAIIGSGGREHSICQKIYNSKKIKKIFCIPGNGGTQQIAENVNIDLKDFDQIKKFLISILTFSAIFSVPPFPGIQNIFSNFEDSLIFLQMACSLPPLPIIAILMYTYLYNGR